MFATSVLCSRNLWPSAPRVSLPAAACPWRVLLWKLDKFCLLQGRKGGVELLDIIGCHRFSMVFQMSMCQECFTDILSLHAKWRYCTIYWFQSVSAILYLISGELPLWHWGPLYTGSVPRLNSYSSTNMHSYTDNIQLFCLVEPVPKLELDRLCTIETAILLWDASCSFQQRF